MSTREKIVNWIKANIKESGCKGIVLGLSGGVDSSLVAALSKEAVGKRKVLTLILPCHSKKDDFKDAKSVAKMLGIKNKILDLSKIYDNLIKLLPKADRITQANLKPRLRMLVLYYFANKFNYLVCGTGNKSELMVGYFTKYGDGAVDLLPLGSLLKTQVKQLAEELNIPQHIINKPPTAGLWPGQTDEGEMGLTYAELDDILERMIDRKKQIASRNKVVKVKQMIASSKHKREISRICQMKPGLTKRKPVD